jgi:glycosyltransferase involved in cell wall biosynthesis
LRDSIADHKITRSPDSMISLAWFSPMPPIRSGIAACSAALVAGLRPEYAIDVFVDEPVARVAEGTHSAHEFIWRQRARPYDLTVYQLGNSSHHDYAWPYAFRWPGLAVLHDAHLHHARAAALLRTARADDYRAEFSANHPDGDPAVAEMAIKGFDSHLYYDWPMTRLVVEASRVTAVHSRATAEALRGVYPAARIEPVRLGHGTLVTSAHEDEARVRVRTRYGLPETALIVGCFGGLTPEKRIPQLLAAFDTVLGGDPAAFLFLAGSAADHYDVRADLDARGLTGRAVLTGYLESDEEMTDCIAASDIAVNLRWPTAREVSGPWLRCLAAGKPTIITDLAHLAGVPSLDPRTWTVRSSRPPGYDPDGTGQLEEAVCVAVDILDEDHSLGLALRRLATDAALRETLGRAARAYWTREHAVESMLKDYRRVIPRAIDGPAPEYPLPAHLTNDGTALLRTLLAPFGMPAPLR